MRPISTSRSPCWATMDETRVSGKTTVSIVLLGFSIKCRCLNSLRERCGCSRSKSDGDRMLRSLFRTDGVPCMTLPFRGKSTEASLKRLRPEIAWQTLPPEYAYSSRINRADPVRNGTDSARLGAGRLHQFLASEGG